LGRYPWTVYGLFTIEDSVSPNVSATSLVISNIVYFVLFSGLALTMVYLIRQELGHGPENNQMEGTLHEAEEDPFDKEAFEG